MRVVNLILAFVFAVSLSYAAPQTAQNYRRTNSIYKICTLQINRTVKPVKTYHSNKRVSIHYIVTVTYCDHYSNGATRIWTSSFLVKD